MICTQHMNNKDYNGTIYRTCQLYQNYPLSIFSTSSSISKMRPKEVERDVLKNSRRQKAYSDGNIRGWYETNDGCQEENMKRDIHDWRS